MLKNRLKHWRHKMEMNQTEFAGYLKVNNSLYNRWEKHDKEPNLESAWQIARKLGCKIEDLFDESLE